MIVSIIDTVRGKIEYSMIGTGKVVLIVHGGHVNCKETIFQKGLDVNNTCIITPSRPGYGNTPLTSFNKTPKDTADLFMALLDTLKISKIIVIGISAGGLTALEIAAHYPDRVDKLVLMSALTKKWFTATNKLYNGGKIAFAPKIEKFTWFLYRGLFRLFPAIMTKMMFRELSKHRLVEFTDNEFNELRNVTQYMRSGFGFYNDLDQTIEQEILTKIECSTLILHSENDNAVDLSHPNNARNNIRNSQLMTFKNRWGHMLWFGTEYEPILSILKNQIGDNQL